MNLTIERPKFINVPLADGLKWRGGGGWLYTEKFDGVWAVRDMLDATFAGEQMRDGSFWAFDCLRIGDSDLRRRPRAERWHNLLTFNGSVLIVPAGNGGEFLETVLSRGGEGVVASHLDAPYGEPWFKCKRVETHDLIVADKIHPSIRLQTAEGEDRGWCCARAKYDEIKLGDVVEVAAYSLTAKGKLREPRLVRIRTDKMGVMRPGL
jgi:ATP-dependent DNA ligase